MLNKILVFGGLAVTAILVIENMVMLNNAYVLWESSQSYILAILCTIIGFLIGYGFKGMTKKDDSDDVDNMTF